MRELQFFGIIVACLIGFYGFWKRKQRRITRFQFLIFAALAAGLLILAAVPSAGDLIAIPLRMNRWNAVLLITNLLTFGLFFYVLNITNSNSRTISRLIRGLAIQAGDLRPLDDADILVIIPAYNEEKNIGLVLSKIPDKLDGLQVRTLVCIDGGTDGTEHIARSSGVAVLVNPINRGGGAALKAGYEVAVHSRAKIVVTLDADGQHRPEEIGQVVAPILADEADFVNGSRVLGTHEAESQVRVAGVVFFNWLITLLMFNRITDASNAFRAIKTELLSKITLYQDQFHTSELLIDAMKKGARVKEVPITILKRHSGTTKKPRSLKYGWGFAKAILETWLR